MNSQTFSLLIIILLLLIQSHNAFSNPSEFYDTCNNTFNCGNNITQIGYPFRGSNDPPYCGHPSFVLTCDDPNNVTTLDIMSTTYRVMEIHPASQTMRIVSEDVMEENGTNCPREMANATLDHSVFDYSGTYVNLTFLYGCPESTIMGSGLIPCGDDDDGAYVLFPGNQVPGNCRDSVIVPVLGNGPGPVSDTGLDGVFRQGVEITWKIDGEACGGCMESNGRCGFNFETNKMTCFCRDPPFISDVCPMVSGASDGNRRSSGMYININFLCNVV
ncbi:hypothetical protein CASFOL_037182 [Castilleja foliolosa]|uniref:non-specific serine/threonine protein kinase n=1 Tax=Castilleja foliolosa TaxID=1961234 RepID=A0ABD3BP89_9LAMI